MAIQALLVILAVLLVLLFLGVPISYAIAVSSLTAILSSIDLNVAVLTAAQRTFVGMSKFSLTAIPFFILAGNIMNQGGIAKRLVDFVMAILGKMPGALLVTNIGTNALFGAISGSASAAAAAVGSMIRDGADEQGYDPAVTAATINQHTFSCWHFYENTFSLSHVKHCDLKSWYSEKTSSCYQEKTKNHTETLLTIIP